MKLILGDPGKPDGWIPPDSFNEKFEDDTNCGNKKIFKINGLEVNLFNITGKIINVLVCEKSFLIIYKVKTVNLGKIISSFS